VDVEWRAGFADLIARNPRRVVLSSHDFQRVPTTWTHVPPRCARPVPAPSRSRSRLRG
jgi:hypothetical protein